MGINVRDVRGSGKRENEKNGKWEIVDALTRRRADAQGQHTRAPPEKAGNRRVGLWVAGFYFLLLLYTFSVFRFPSAIFHSWERRFGILIAGNQRRSP